MNYNPLILEAAGNYVGEAEWPGAKNNPVIQGFFAASGHSEKMADEVPWCAAFVGAVLAQVGLIGTGKLNARSYVDWGEEVPISQAKPGDIVVFWRVSPQSWQGHVAFFLHFKGDRVVVRGGNQRNKVSDEEYPTSQIIAVRRAVRRNESGYPTLRIGSKGQFVRTAQQLLKELGYFPGNLDGHFGPNTQKALLAFQADHGLPTNGVVDDQVWKSLNDGVPREQRNLTTEDLRERGSTIVKNSDTIDVVAGITGVGATVSAVTASVQEAEGALAVLSRIVTEHWPMLLIAGALVTVVVLSGRIRAARLRDAQSGAHMGR